MMQVLTLNELQVVSGGNWRDAWDKAKNQLNDNVFNRAEEFFGGRRKELEPEHEPKTFGAKIIDTGKSVAYYVFETAKLVIQVGILVGVVFIVGYMC
jgi:hypothetical protein